MEPYETTFTFTIITLIPKFLTNGSNIGLAIKGSLEAKIKNQKWQLRQYFKMLHSLTLDQQL